MNRDNLTIFGGGVSGMLLAAGLTYALGKGFWFILGNALLSWAYVAFWVAKYVIGV